jgi:hypothetical protein
MVAAAGELNTWVLLRLCSRSAISLVPVLTELSHNQLRSHSCLVHQPQWQSAKIDIMGLTACDSPGDGLLILLLCCLFLSASQQVQGGQVQAHGLC